MQLSRFTDYSVRVLLFSAANPDRLVTLAEISQFYDISLEHLRKVVHNLGKLGYLKTHRGKKGGMRLNLAPSDINMGEVIAKVEGDNPLIDCRSLNCSVQGLCALPQALIKAKRAFYQELYQYSLDDLVDKEAMRALIDEEVIATCA